MSGDFWDSDEEKLRRYLREIESTRRAITGFDPFDEEQRRYRSVIALFEEDQTFRRALGVTGVERAISDLKASEHFSSIDGPNEEIRRILENNGILGPLSKASWHASVIQQALDNDPSIQAAQEQFERLKTSLEPSLSAFTNQMPGVLEAVEQAFIFTEREWATRSDETAAALMTHEAAQEALKLSLPDSVRSTLDFFQNQYDSAFALMADKLGLTDMGTVTSAFEKALGISTPWHELDHRLSGLASANLPSDIVGAHAAEFMHGIMSTMVPDSDIAFQGVLAASVMAAGGWHDLERFIGRSPLIDFMAATSATFDGRGFSDAEEPLTEDLLLDWVRATFQLIERHLEKASGSFERYYVLKFAYAIVPVVISILALWVAIESNDLTRQASTSSSRDAAETRSAIRDEGDDTRDTIREQGDASRETIEREIGHMTSVLEEMSDKLDRPAELARPGVVVIAMTTLFSEPSETSDHVVALYPNQQVHLLREHDAWLAVSFFDYISNRPVSGWIKKEHIERE